MSDYRYEEALSTISNPFENWYLLKRERDKINHLQTVASNTKEWDEFDEYQKELFYKYWSPQDKAEYKDMYNLSKRFLPDFTWDNVGEGLSFLRMYLATKNFKPEEVAKDPISLKRISYLKKLVDPNNFPMTSAVLCESLDSLKTKKNDFRHPFLPKIKIVYQAELLEKGEFRYGEYDWIDEASIEIKINFDDTTISSTTKIYEGIDILTNGLQASLHHLDPEDRTSTIQSWQKAIANDTTSPQEEVKAPQR